jgi:hypothetical protein
MKTLKMSRKERDRLTIMAGVKPPGTDTGARRLDGGLWRPLVSTGRQHEALNLGRRKVIVRTLRDGRVQLVSRGRKLKWRELPGRPLRVKAKLVKVQRAALPPSANHQWRRFGMGVGRELLARGEGERTAGDQINEQQPKKRGHSLLS